MSIKSIPNTADTVNVNQTATRHPHPSIGQIQNADKDPAQMSITDGNYPSGAGLPGSGPGVTYK